MTDEQDMLADAVGGVMAELCRPTDVSAAESEGWAPRLWSALASAGYPFISVPESTGGVGGTIADACVMLTIAGRFAAPLPLVETSLIAGWALSSVGVSLSGGPITAAPASENLKLTCAADGSWQLDGQMNRVPWASACELIVTVIFTGRESMVVAVRPARATILQWHNLAGEPYESCRFDKVMLDTAELFPAPAGVTVEALELRGALGRAALIAGALSRVSELTNRYTSERHQFGRPLARFQAVQQHIVRIAEETALSAVAVRAASATPEPQLLEVAAAKAVASEAATIAAAAAHQAHGAMGMTREYELGQLSRRLWSWRDDYGSERHWHRALGGRLVRAGPDALWPNLVDDAWSAEES